MHSQESDSSVGLWPTFYWGLCAYTLLVVVQSLVAVVLAAATVEADAKEMVQEPVFAARALAVSFFVATPLLWMLLRVATHTVRDRNTYLGLKSAPAQSFGVVLGLVAALFCLSVGLDSIFDRPSIHAFTDSLHEASARFWIVPIFASIVLLGPFLEELLYRGFLLAGFSHSPLGPYGGSLVVAILFAGSHFQYEGSYLLQVFLLGLILCGLRIRYASIWPAYFAHALNNFGAWLYAMLFSANATS